MNIENQLINEFNIKRWQVSATINLIDEGNTIPFIARYRKEATGSLNDEILREFNVRLKYLRNLDEKKNSIIQTIQEQGKLTDELRENIDSVLTLVELEDLYRPFKPKKRTRAMIAKESNLEPIARLILSNEKSIYDIANEYICETFDTVDKVIMGGKDIIAEEVSDNPTIRSYVRREIFNQGFIVSKAKIEEDSTYSNYYDFKDKISAVAGYKVLALNRGEKEKILSVTFDIDVDKIQSYIYDMYRDDKENILLYEAIVDSFKRLIYPSVERDIRNELTEKSQSEAINVFKTNLKQLLMQPPIVGKNVIGWDPAFRTGCKLAVISGTGQVLETLVIYPTQPQNKITEAKEIINKLVDKYNVELIALGNGTASRESEQVIVDFIKEYNKKLFYVIVNEAGASVYSASKLATEEFPELSEGARSAVSIARRLQDPLAELVKIDPKSIGVGQYQHDMNQKNLQEALSGVVEDCVNMVGADLNTASPALLENISGLNKSVCKNIVSYRENNGAYKNRQELLKVSKLGNKMFEQCAGFLRVNGGDEPLDRTAVHPENYEVTYKILDYLGYNKDMLKANKCSIDLKNIDINKLSSDLNIGLVTANDIIKELEKPSRDPRDEMPKPVLRSDILSLEDLKDGMILKGTVRNVIDFGAFVDIGVHDDGMLHISEISDKFIKHPSEIVKVGDIVTVKIIGIDLKRKRIALSMKNI